MKVLPNVNNVNVLEALPATPPGSNIIAMADDAQHPSATALRDALGLVRLLHGATTDEDRRMALARAGQQLAHAFEMCRKPPETLGFKSVPLGAESAFTVLRKMTWAPDVTEIIDVAKARVEASQARAYDVEARAARSQHH